MIKNRRLLFLAKITVQCVLILLFLFFGEIVHRFLLPSFPSSLIGMFALFTALYLKILTPIHLKEVADVLLNNMSLFFIVPGLALFTSSQLFLHVWWQILLIILLSTLVVMGVTAKVFETLAGKDDN